MKTEPVACIVGWHSCLVILTPAGVGAAEPPAMKRVLLLLGGLGDQGNARFGAAFVEVLRAADSVPIDVRTETMDAARFPRAERFFGEYLKNKYADRKIDVIVVVGIEDLNFARQNREMFGNPLIVAAVSQAGEIDRNDNITGLLAGPAVSINGMIDLMLALRPDTCCVFFVDGIRGNTGEYEAEINGDGMNQPRIEPGVPPGSSAQ